ncbi:MAG TPA: DUF1573 domain-containing protein, partial [Saprospiraceae bacterium]|nr:DUF1573 domain-containing protein [Saprospiraceae bacterium]
MCTALTLSWAGPQPVFSATQIQFGELLQGKSDTRTLWVYNAGDAAYLMTSISSTQAVFVVEPNIGIVEPGDTLAIQITFQPPAVLGIYQADLVIQATTGTTQIPMQGAVVLPTTLSHAPD